MPKPKLLLASLLLALGLCACATPGKTPPTAPPSIIQLAKPKLPEPPPEAMVKRDANFQERLVNFFSPSPGKPTK